MSIMFYLQADEVDEFETKRREASLREDIQLGYILCTNTSIYPINKLRNLAIQHVNTSHIYVSDMDNWPGGIFLIICQILYHFKILFSTTIFIGFHVRFSNV